MVHLERRTVLVRAIKLSEEGEELLRRVGELIAPLADSQMAQQGMLSEQQCMLSEQQRMLSEHQHMLSEQQRTLGEHQRLLGGLVEDGARRQISKMLGEDYLRPLLARLL